MRSSLQPFFACAAAVLLLSGCARPVPGGAIVVTELPVQPEAQPPRNPTVLDDRYPAGSRVVVTWPPFSAAETRVLSKGLTAAGGPILANDAQRVLFVGKATRDSAWQIYSTDLDGGTPSLLTDVAGGAMDPALLKDGRVVFAAPVPSSSTQAGARKLPQLHVKSPSDGRITRLTFAPGGASDPVLLQDGRILFVSGMPGAGDGSGTASALFIINTDGTEFTAFCGQNDPRGLIRRPRALGDGRVAFLRVDNKGATSAEAVSLARPHASRTRLAASATCIEPGTEGAALLCGDNASPGTGQSKGGVWKLQLARNTLEQALPPSDRRQVEAVLCFPRPQPMGRASAMNPAKKAGLILCLDVNRSSLPARDGLTGRAARLRITALRPTGREETLGEIPVQPDGSIMAEIPSDVPLGFETLDEQGRVLRRQPPLPWVRSGENRTCVGCHEPPNHSPRNARPLAVDTPPHNLARATISSVAAHSAQP